VAALRQAYGGASPTGAASRSADCAVRYPGAWHHADM